MTELESVLSQILKDEQSIPSFEGEFGYELYVNLNEAKLIINPVNNKGLVFIGYYIAYQKEELIEDLNREIEREKLFRKMLKKGLF